MNEKTLKELMKRDGITLIGELTLEERALNWQRAVKIILPPKDVSDGTCIKNISRWLVEQVKSNKFDEYAIFRRVLDFAVEASGPGARNPFAVFISILKKELNYLKI